MARAHGHAHANFLCALGHRHQHDVHHANAAHHQRNHGNGRDQQGHGLGGFFNRLLDAVGIDGKEIFSAMALSQQSSNALFRGCAVHAIMHAHGDGAEIVGAHEAAHHRGVRHPDIERFGVAKSHVFFLGHADDARGHAADQQHLADGVFALGKKGFFGARVDHGILHLAAHAVRIEKGAMVQRIAAHAKELGTHT